MKKKWLAGLASVVVALLLSAGVTFAAEAPLYYEGDDPYYNAPNHILPCEDWYK